MKIIKFLLVSLCLSTGIATAADPSDELSKEYHAAVESILKTKKSSLKNDAARELVGLIPYLLAAGDFGQSLFVGDHELIIDKVANKLGRNVDNFKGGALLAAVILHSLLKKGYDKFITKDTSLAKIEFLKKYLTDLSKSTELSKQTVDSIYADLAEIEKVSCENKMSRPRRVIGKTLRNASNIVDAAVLGLAAYCASDDDDKATNGIVVAVVYYCIFHILLTGQDKQTQKFERLAELRQLVSKIRVEDPSDYVQDVGSEDDEEELFLDYRR